MDIAFFFLGIFFSSIILCVLFLQNHKKHRESIEELKSIYEEIGYLKAIQDMNAHVDSLYDKYGVDRKDIQ